MCGLARPSSTSLFAPCIRASQGQSLSSASDMPGTACAACRYRASVQLLSMNQHIDLQSRGLGELQTGGTPCTRRQGPNKCAPRAALFCTCWPNILNTGITTAKRDTSARNPRPIPASSEFARLYHMEPHLTAAGSNRFLKVVDR